MPIRSNPRSTDVPPLDLETALATCRAVQDAARGRPWTLAWWQCGGCRRFGGTAPEKMCIGAEPGYRGCQLVNRRLTRQS